ncbi:hypothetical protein [Methanoculleus sp. MH98A]|uniref:hypothetical protein n=1 Tax=Methanoculleus sp. MH98A TaxID=1495314 RepID=UPI00049F4F2E|nr:hypothetical protein [Methanoculleus sp. MH98A]KDE55682.1 hypothetical protein EI28_05470 [Methanoculleus sp. MH98A]
MLLLRFYELSHSKTFGLLELRLYEPSHSKTFGLLELRLYEPSQPSSTGGRFSGGIGFPKIKVKDFIRAS